jgi:hypothetical protein
MSDAEARAQAKERLKKVGLALHEYDSANQQFPAGFVCKSDESGKAGGVGLSWRVALLRFLGHEDLFKQFKLDEPWDSEHNKTLIEQMPEVYASPGKPAAKGQTYLQAFSGPGAFLAAPPRTSERLPGHSVRGRKIPAEFADGYSNTLAVAEAAEPVIWTKPDDLEFDGKELPKLGGVFPDGFHGLIADGQELFFPKELTSDDILRGLITIDGKEVIDLNPIRKANGVKELDYRKLTPPPPPPTSKPGGEPKK